MLARSRGLGGTGRLWRLSEEAFASRRNSGFGAGEMVRGGEGPGAAADSPFLFMFSNLALSDETGFCVWSAL